MPRLAKLNIQYLRNISSLSLVASPGLNLIHGANGSGKTSILEALYLIGMGRSFRGSQVRPLIQEGQDSCSVHAKLGDGLALGMSKALRGKQQLRIAGRNAENAAELARALPLQLINSDTFRILEGSPGVRRRFLDWGVFHVEHSYLDTWRQMQRVLLQRNNLLKQQAKPPEIIPWTREFARLGEQVSAFRESYLTAFLPVAREMIAALLPMEDLELEYERGWSGDQPLLEVLEAGLARDLRYGHTAAGPQRADIRIRVGRNLAAEVLSRGQEKLLIVSLKLAQGSLLQQRRGQTCIYLLDDLPAELDRGNRLAVCGKLESLESQVFLTCVEHEALDGCWPTGESKLFHVKHGKIV